ncbi:hypothetical protein GCM10010433_32070 [Streptomyces pulveraceus]
MHLPGRGGARGLPAVFTRTWVRVLPRTAATGRTRARPSGPVRRVGEREGPRPRAVSPRNDTEVAFTEVGSTEVAFTEAASTEVAFTEVASQHRGAQQIRFLAARADG